MRNRISTNLVIIVALMLSACGASAREKTLKATYIGLNAASEGFVSYDKEHQARIVKAATSIEEGATKLAAYRVDQLRVYNLFAAAFQSLAAAAIVNNDPKSLTSAVAAAKLALDAFNHLKEAK